jgi:hypothetical protein
MGVTAPRQAEGQRSGFADIKERCALRAWSLRNGAFRLEDKGKGLRAEERRMRKIVQIYANY